jgi:hypothetical protein
MITFEILEGIRVLYRQPDTLSLWGIPYGMRPGQAPRDLWRGCVDRGKPTPPPDWVWLGSPGWYGYMSAPERAVVEAFVGQLLKKDDVPNGPGEWSEVRP